MRVWREESERGRERGWRSLNEWLLRRPGREIPVRLAEISLGTSVSSCVAAYFALIAESSSDREELRRKIRIVVAAIGCLKVEEDRSVVIDMFLLAASYAETTIRIGEAHVRTALQTLTFSIICFYSLRFFVLFFIIFFF